MIKKSMWAVAAKTNHGDYVIMTHYWYRPNHPSELSVPIFQTRRLARLAQKRCAYKDTKVVRVSVTIEME